MSGSVSRRYLLAGRLERARAAGGVAHLARFPKLPGNDEGRLLAWASLCRTLIASNDFIYVP